MQGWDAYIFTNSFSTFLIKFSVPQMICYSHYFVLFQKDMNQNSQKRINKAFLGKIKYGIVIKLIKRTLLNQEGARPT